MFFLSENLICLSRDDYSQNVQWTETKRRTEQRSLTALSLHTLHTYTTAKHVVTLQTNFFSKEKLKG